MAEITLLARAESDVLRIYADCESRASGRGEGFSLEVEKSLTLLARMPRLGRFVGTPYRRMKLSRLPYSLIYTVESQRVMIQTVVSNYESLDIILRQLRRQANFPIRTLGANLHGERTAHGLAQKVLHSLSGCDGYGSRAGKPVSLWPARNRQSLQFTLSLPTRPRICGR